MERSIRGIALADFYSYYAPSDAFKKSQYSLCNAVELLHTDDTKSLRVYTYASDRLWAGMGTQVTKY